MSSYPTDSSPASLNVSVVTAKPHTVASLKRATAQILALAKREEKRARDLATAAAKLKMALRCLEEAKEHTGDVRREITLDAGGR